MAPRILAVIVAHPFRKICGATNAGMALSQATAELADLELAVMWDADESFSLGRLRVRRVRCTTPAGPLSGLLPRQVHIALTTSDIPRMIAAGGYDLVHIHNLFPLYAAEQITRACVASRTPFVISTHGFFELNTYTAIRRFHGVKAAAARALVVRPFRRILKEAAGFFCLSPADVDLLQQLGIPRRLTRVVTNGVGEYFLDPPSADEVEQTRTKFELTCDRPVLLFMGSLHAYKGIDVFLKSLAFVGGGVQAIVAGGFRHPGEPHALLDQSGLQEDLKRLVTFTGSVTDAELRALYRLADVFVYPTQGDTLPLVVLEAMASGLPVVSTTVGGIAFQVRPDCGVLTARNDPAATGRAVRELLNDPDRRRRLGAAGRRRVETVFRWNAAAHAAADGYTAVLNQGIAGAPYQAATA